MPVAPHVTYPGVYIQEVPSQVHTITPVPTSTTAFVGRALRGPVDEPVLIHSPAEFDRIFGGLWIKSRLGYAVRDFFLNGGSDALIVRVYKAGNGTAATASLDLSVFQLEASNPGRWGAELSARIDKMPATLPGSNGQQRSNPLLSPLKESLQLPGTELDSNDIFNLTLYDAGTGTTETINNVTAVDSQRRIDKVLEHESRLVRFKGDWAASVTSPGETPPAPAGQKWWENDTSRIKATDGDDGAALDSEDIIGNEAAKSGMYALEKADIFNLLVLPPVQSGSVDIAAGDLQKAAEYCTERRAILLVDPPSTWADKDAVKDGYPLEGLSPNANAAIFFPRIAEADPLRKNQIEVFAPAGAVAGIIARTDSQRGVWKAPAGQNAGLNGVYNLSVNLTDAENGELNPLGINCLRDVPAAGFVVWGARTMVGDDRLASEWKYLPVRRTALFIEESLYRGTQWAVFEPNDEPLWSQLRLNIGSFMHGLFRQGAFQGQSPKDAYFVKCDSTTTTQADIDRGIVNVVVGFAPLKPAEFIVLYIQQIAGNLNT
jgi:phage tail sheath protein FI